MIRKRIFYLFIVVFTMLIANIKTSAQNIEQIYMKSGSVVEGYIAEQKPGNKHLAIQTIKATIVVSSDSLQNTITERVPLESLSEEWQEWALRERKYIEKNGLRLLEIVTLEFEHAKYSKVFLLERGSIIKFIDLTPGKYTFRVDEILKTVKSQRPENLFSGVKEMLVLVDNSRIEGQIIEQIPNKDIKIIDENGDIFSCSFSDVKEIRSAPLSDKYDLWSQIQLLDKIKVKGESEDLVGFISSRLLGQEIVFQFESGEQRRIPLNQVLLYSKIPNEKYCAVYDRIMDAGQVFLNDKEAYFVQLEQRGHFLIMGEVVSEQLRVGEKVCLEARVSDISTPVTLVKAHDEELETNNTGKKKKKNTKPQLYTVITFQDLVQSCVPMVREITPLGNLKITFTVMEKGDYVLYIQGRNEYIVINVIE